MIVLGRRSVMKHTAHFPLMHIDRDSLVDLFYEPLVNMPYVCVV
jgi:hypothetical protein